MALMVLIGMIGVGCPATETEENVPDAVVGWAGTWIDSTGTLVLTEDGMNVSGVYIDPQNALYETLEGTISEDGKILSGSWSQIGSFSFVLSDDGTYFNGTFGYGKNTTIGEGNEGWNGTLTTKGDIDNPWSGTWISEIGGITTLKQDGKVVNGTYEKLDPEDFSVIEGIISEDGKKLTGTWKEIGLFRLTISNDGMFNGTYGFGSNESIEGIEENWNGIRTV